MAACRPIQAPSPQPGGGAILPRGRLAFIGGDGNVYTAFGNSRSPVPLTKDATVAAEGSGRSYHRLAWSPAGHLAFAAVERGLGYTRSELFIASLDGTLERVASNEEHFVIYLYWSPLPCSAEDVCHSLAYLIGGESGIHLQHIEQAGGSIRNRMLGAAQPFYFSWSADGQQMLWHRNGSRRHHEDASITLFQLDERNAVDLPHAPGYFLAPAWSPTGRHWLDVVDTGAVVTLRLVDAHTGAAIPLVEAEFDIAFVWSPDGQQVAYAARGYGTDPFLAPIHLYDIASRTTQRLTDEDLRVQAFFWSPDGRRLGYIHWLGMPGQSWAQWRVIDVISGQDRGFNAFNPSFHMRMLIGSFNQYAQSHRLWSPDGRYLTYADRDRTLIERVWLVDTQAEKGAPPIPVAEGSFAVWSWE